MPAEDVTQMILAALTRIEGKVDEQTSQTGRINERLAKIEAKQEAQEAVNKRVDELYSLKDRGMGVKQLGAWMLATGIAIASFFRG